MSPEQIQQVGRCILNEAQDAFIIVDPASLRVVEANSSAERLLGYPHPMRGRAISDLLHADDGRRGEELIRVCRSTTPPAVGDGLSLKTGEGGRVPVHVTVSRIAGDPQPLALLALRDLTRQKETEAALRASEQRHRSVVEGSLQGILIHQDGHICYVNAALVRMFDYEHADELVGRPLWSTFVVPDNLAELQERTRTILAGEPTPPHPGWGRAVGKTGRSIWVSTAASRIEWQGRPAVVSFYVDVTERRAAEEAVKASRRMLQLVLDNIPQGVFWKDRALRYVGCNRVVARAFGLEHPKHIYGLTDHQLAGLSHEQAEFFIQKDREVMASNTPELGIIEPATLADGTSIWMETSKLPMHDETGQVIGVLGTWQDITARKRAEEERRKLDAQLQHTQKLESLGVLAGGIAHDFNNLLTSILGYADSAMLELPPTSSTRQLVAEVMNGARRAAELTNQMLAYSGKGRFVVQPVDLSEIVDGLRRLLQVSISKKCVVQCNLMPGLPAIEADAAQMRQIIMNLIINAAEAIGEKSGVIAVSTGVMHCTRGYLAEAYLDENLAEGHYVYVEVADTGAGMNEETRKRIFDPFFTTKFTGRGLGLAAALGIVRGHRGAVKVYSEVGKGTTFKVLFPATGQPALTLPPHASTLADWRGSGVALVVDDEESVRTLARHMLQTMGFTVLTAADGREATEIFRGEADRLAFVLLDMTMPHMDGAETYREMKRIRSDVRAILSSGYNEQTATSQFAGKNLAAFIQKPYSYEDLMAVVRKVLVSAASERTRSAD